MALIHQGLKKDGFDVSMVKLGHCFGEARRSVSKMLSGAALEVKSGLAEPIKAMIEAEHSLRYRTGASPLGMSNDTLQRIFQIEG